MKTKDKRDFALMIFMAVITIIFFVYIFLPSGEPHKKDHDFDTSHQKHKQMELDKEPALKEKTADFYTKLNEIIVDELSSIYLNSTASENFFEDYYTENLRMILTQSENFLSNKRYNSSFFHCSWFWCNNIQS